jgi:hypothetical protein
MFCAPNPVFPPAPPAGKLEEGKLLAGNALDCMPEFDEPMLAPALADPMLPVLMP